MRKEAASNLQKYCRMPGTSEMLTVSWLCLGREALTVSLDEKEYAPHSPRS